MLSLGKENYEGYSKDYNFPNPKYDWRALSERLVARIAGHADGFRGRMAPIYQQQTFELAMELLKCSPPRNQEALRLLEAAAPGVNDDHQFWIFACKYNIVQKTKDKAMRDDVMRMGEAILSRTIKVPEAKMANVKDLVASLREKVKNT